MKKIFATQLNGGHIGQKVRVSIEGTEAVVEDVLKEVRHERVGLSLVTFVRLATVAAPARILPSPMDALFRFDLNDKLEVPE